MIWDFQETPVIVLFYMGVNCSKYSALFFYSSPLSSCHPAKKKSSRCCSCSWLEYQRVFKRSPHQRGSSCGPAEPGVVWLSPDAGEWYSWARAWVTDRSRPPVNLVQWISSSAGCITLLTMGIFAADGPDGCTGCSLGSSDTAGRGLHGCRPITSHTAVVKLVLNPPVGGFTLVQIVMVGIDGWFVMVPCGDWLSIPRVALGNCLRFDCSQGDRGLRFAW